MPAFCSLLGGYPEVTYAFERKSKNTLRVHVRSQVTYEEVDVRSPSLQLPAPPGLASTLGNH